MKKNEIRNPNIKHLIFNTHIQCIYPPVKRGVFIRVRIAFTKFKTTPHTTTFISTI